MQDEKQDGFTTIVNVVTSTTHAVADVVHVLVRQRAIRPRQGRAILRLLAKRSGTPEFARALEIRARGLMFQNPRKGKRRI